MDIGDMAVKTAKILLDTKSVLLNADEPFLYTSGAIGPVYVDCRRLISFPHERAILMDFGAEIVRSLNVDYVAGGETAGIPYAAFIAERLNKPMVYVRKKPKGFGRMAQIEGFIGEESQKTVIIEDVQNFGFSVKVFIDALRGAGEKVEDVFVIFEHGHKQSRKNMQDFEVTLHSLCNWRDVLEVLKEDPGYTDDKTLKSVEAYLDDPKKWAEDNAHKVKERASHT